MEQNKIINNIDVKKFPFQQCQDERLNYKFRQLHKYLVNQIINFCKSHNIIIDEFYLNADELSESIKFGSWQPCTDSCLTFHKFTDEYKDAVSMKKVVDDKEWKRIKLEQKPFMQSM